MIADLLLLACVGAIALPVAWWLRPGVVLAISMVIGVVQIFLTKTLDVPVAVAWQLACAATVLRHRRELPRLKVGPWLFVGYVALSFVTLLWSPDPLSGLTLCTQLLGLGAMIALATIVHRRGEGAPVLVALAAVAAVSAVSIILFRLLPSLEEHYFSTPWFGLFNGQVLAGDFITTQRNNALDSAKTGGLFFVNANAASLFCGASAALLIARGVVARPLIRTVVYGLVATDVFALSATGSKTGLYLTALLSVLVVGAALLRLRRRPTLLARSVLGAAGTVAAVFLVLPAVFGAVAAAQESATKQSLPSPTASAEPSTGVVLQGWPTSPVSSPATQTGQAEQEAGATGTAAPDLADQSSEALGTRLQTWRTAAVLAEQQPMGWFGFGGWHERYRALAARDGTNPDLPPHNWVLQAWSDTGVLSVALLVAIIATMAVGAVRLQRRSSLGGSAAAAHLWSGAAVLWVLLHGLGDNTGIYGGPRMLVVTAIAVVWVVSPAPCVARPPRGSDLVQPAPPLPSPLEAGTEVNALVWRPPSMRESRSRAHSGVIRRVVCRPQEFFSWPERGQR